MRAARAFGSAVFRAERREQLMAENESLKAQLAELRVVADELPTSTPDTIHAMVYSDYPLNFKNEHDGRCRLRGRRRCRGRGSLRRKS